MAPHRPISSRINDADRLQTFALGDFIRARNGAFTVAVTRIVWFNPGSVGVLARLASTSHRAAQFANLFSRLVVFRTSSLDATSFSRVNAYHVLQCRDGV